MNSLINRSLSKTLAIIAVATSLMGAANVARAVLINVTVAADGHTLLNTVGAATQAEYNAANGGSNGDNPTRNFNFLVTEVGYYNGWHLVDLPDPDNSPSAIDTPAANVEGLTGDSYMTLGGWDYVVIHWGAGQTNSPGGWFTAYYLGGTAASLTLPELNGKSFGEFSNARYYNQDVDGGTHSFPPVPDSGSTVISLGLALLAIGLMARKTKIG